MKKLTKYISEALIKKHAKNNAKGVFSIKKLTYSKGLDAFEAETNEVNILADKLFIYDELHRKLNKGDKCKISLYGKYNIRDKYEYDPNNVFMGMNFTGPNNNFLNFHYFEDNNNLCNLTKEETSQIINEEDIIYFRKQFERMVTIKLKELENANNH